MSLDKVKHIVLVSLSPIFPRFLTKNPGPLGQRWRRKVLSNDTTRALPLPRRPFRWNSRHRSYWPLDSPPLRYRICESKPSARRMDSSTSARRKPRRRHRFSFVHELRLSASATRRCSGMARAKEDCNGSAVPVRRTLG